ncbi:hypothetical protein P8452_29157 [Trifolium repens]|nr:hypothetical protein P8452_29157 [Trifolium repens]
MSSSSSSSKSIEEQLYINDLAAALRPPPPSTPTSSFDNVPQRPSKPQPCIILPHPSFPGVYVSGDHDDDDESSLLYTRNLVPGVQSLNQDVVFSVQDENEGTVEYREWDPFKSRLAAAILSGAQNIWIKPGSRVLVVYSHSRDDAHFGITISHISDIVGPQGMVYVVEESDCNCNSLLDMADKRFNIVPIVYGSPYQYRMLINIVDVLFAAPDRPEEVRSAFLNATCFLKTGGHYMLYVQGNCIESTNRGDGVFSSLCATHQVQFKRMERVTLEPFDRDHAYVSGVFRTLEIAEIDQRCLVSDKFWTSKVSYSEDGRPIGCLYQQQKNRPVYMLFESSCGYVLFRAQEVYKVERNYVEIEKYIKSFEKSFEFVGCHTFASRDEAVMYLTADNNDRVPDKLIQFLEQHLPPPMEDGEPCYSLYVPNPFMASEIVSNAKIACAHSPFLTDIIRGVRMNIDKFFQNMKPRDLEKAQVDLARIYSRQRLGSPDKGKLTKKRPLASVPTRRNPQRKARAVTKTK